MRVATIQATTNILSTLNSNTATAANKLGFRVTQEISSASIFSRIAFSVSILLLPIIQTQTSTSK